MQLVDLNSSFVFKEEINLNLKKVIQYYTHSLIRNEIENNFNCHIRIKREEQKMSKHVPRSHSSEKSGQMFQSRLDNRV